LVFLVALAVLTKKSVLIEVINDDDHENILLLASPALPHHGDAAVLSQGDCHHTLVLPCTSLPYAHGGEGREAMMMMMTIQEAMTTSMMSNPVRPTHNNQP
jgi:hypothetical protein